MNKNKITKYQWKKYLLVQKSGIINMNDIRRGAFLIGESMKMMVWDMRYGTTGRNKDQ